MSPIWGGTRWGASVRSARRLLRGGFRARQICRLKIQEIGDLTGQVVLVFRDLSVGEHQPPHDLREHHFLPETEAALEDRGELKMIHGSPAFVLGDREQ